MSASRLTAKRRVGLSTAEQLRLEDHLQHCDACRAEAHHLAALSALSNTSTPALNERQRERVLRNALASVDQPTSSTAAEPSRRRRMAPWLVGGTAAACAAGIALSLIPGSDAPTPEETPVVATRTPAQARLLSGQVIVAGIALSADDKKVAGIALSADGTLSPTQDVTSEHGAVLALAHGRVSLHAASTVRWSHATSTVTLLQGSVRAKVDASVERPFRVATNEFTVHVVGTEFEVSTTGVRVDEGIVRITSRAGHVLVERLEPGHSWRIERPTSGATAAAPRTPPTKTAKATRTTTPTQTQVSAAALLLRARTHLAAGDVTRARALVNRTRALRPTQTVRAEADTLLAECALVAGDRAEAVRLYLAVADRYQAMTAGENALFAAARIEVRRGRTAAARHLLKRYVDHYPAGRFSGEATRRLDDLAPPADKR